MALQRTEWFDVAVGVVSTERSTTELTLLSLTIFDDAFIHIALGQAEISSVRSRGAESAQALLETHRRESADMLVLHSVSRLCAVISHLESAPADDHRL